MPIAQPGILAPVPSHARYLSFNLIPGSDPHALRQQLQNIELDPNWVVGLGPALVSHLGGQIDGLKVFPSYSANAIDIPSTPYALWLWLRGDDRGELLHQGRQLCQKLAFAFTLEQVVDGFKHGEGRDLSGYIDGTENPEDEAAIQAAFSHQPELHGSSFVAVQQWLHDFKRLDSMPQQHKDHSIGRRLSDNEELDDAPESAHVKRTAQESFTPEAFILRRSMPWSDAQAAGLMFVSFSHSLEPFEAQLQRMIGLDDGISDALFQFTRPLSGSYYWCPSLHDGNLNLDPIGANL